MRVFVRRIQLGHGLGIAGFGHEEDRIVAEAVAAARLKADAALAHAVDGVHLAVGPHQRHDAMKPSRARGLRHAGQLRQQQLVAILVGTRLRCAITRRKDPRRAVQSIHVEARVVGPGQKAGGSGIGTSLLDGVVGKRCACFLSLKRDPLGVQIGHFERKIGQQRTVFAHLALVVGGYQQLLAHHCYLRMELTAVG